MKSSPSRGISSLPKINPAGADNLPNTRRNTLSKYSMLRNHSVCLYIYTTTASTQTVFSEGRLRYIHSTSIENSSEILRLVFSAADGIPALESMGLRCRSMLEQIHSICIINNRYAHLLPFISGSSRLEYQRRESFARIKQVKLLSVADKLKK